MFRSKDRQDLMAMTADRDQWISRFDHLRELHTDVRKQLDAMVDANLELGYRLRDKSADGTVTHLFGKPLDEIIERDKIVKELFKNFAEVLTTYDKENG